MAGKQFGLLRKGKDLLPDTPHQEGVIPVWEISSPNSAVCEQGVPCEKFLKKCHVEHKRIRRMSGDGPQFKVDTCQRKGAGRLIKNVVNLELLNRNREAPLHQGISELEFRSERFGSVDGDPRLVE